MTNTDTTFHLAVYNGTPHAINFIHKEDCGFSDPRRIILKNPNASYRYIIPEGKPLNAVKVNLAAPKGDFPFGVVGAVKFESVDPLPKGFDYYIVSNLYRAACLELGIDTSKLAVVDSVVYEEKGIQPIGCLNLAIG